MNMELIRAEIDNCKKDIALTRYQIDQLLKKLENEFNVNTIQEARELIDSINLNITKLRASRVELAKKAESIIRSIND